MKKTYKSIATFIVLLSLMTFNLSAQLSGIVTIDATQATAGTNYQTFNALATVLNTSGISGPLVVNVVASTGPYVEQVQFNAITGVSAQNTITVNGNGNTVTFNNASNAAAPWIILLNGADRLNFNNLSVIGTGFYAYCAHLTNGADYNNFTACTFSVNPNVTSSTQFPVVFSGSQTTWSSYGNTGNYNKFLNCIMRNGYTGVQMYGNFSSPWITDNTIENCSIEDWYLYGIFTNYCKNTILKKNVISRPTRTTWTTTYGIRFDYQNGSICDGNRIQNLYGGTGGNTNTGTCYALYSYWNSANGGGANRNIIRNNIITGMDHNGTAFGIYAPYIDGFVYHNTVSIDNVASTSGSFCYGIYCFFTNGYDVWVRDNIVSITRGGTGTKYGVYYNAGVTSNYNDIYMNAAGGTNYAGYYNANAVTLANLQGLGTDANSVSLDPQYTSLAGNNFIPTNTAVNNLGTPVGVSQDIAGLPRSGTVPDMGAHEFLSIQCAGTPSANTVNTPTYALCPFNQTDVTIGTYYSDLGITYQWLTSTTSSVGPFTAVPGATNINVTTPQMTVNTWYQVVMTCTNGGGSIQPVGLVQVAGTSFSNVPYYESFEGIPRTNTLPNCSWATSSNLGGTCQTYTASNTLGRTPRTGSNFASFFYNPGATNYFYTNGINLVAGITYSAALWYQSEYYGWANWTDLSILYGATQTTTGLTSICSTNGPAISTTSFKKLDGLFTVPTSGVYYIAVRGTGNTSASAQWLTWDDLSITIPCQPGSANTPTLNVSANSMTVCAGDPVVLTAVGADTYTWNTGANTNVVTENPTTTQTYTVTGTNSLTGCNNSGTQMVYVNPSPNVLVYASTASVCAGSPANLTAFGAASYTWNTGVFGANVTVSPAASTNYTVLGSNAFGCTGAAVQAMAVVALPNINASSSAPTEMCVGETQVLTATGGITYQWVASPSGLLLSGASVNVNPLITTVYTVTGTNAAGCSNKFTLTQAVSECVGLNQIAGTLTGVKIYPNPTAGEFTVELNNSSVKTVVVTDVTGRIISSNTSASDVVKVNLNNLSSGVYYVKVQSNNAVEVVKVIKH
jgi:hypothetical protein